jgi:hypothetical protein
VNTPFNLGMISRFLDRLDRAARRGAADPDADARQRARGDDMILTGRVTKKYLVDASRTSTSR